MIGAMDLGIADHGERASREQAAQIAIALFADTAKLVFAPARVLLRHEPHPGREVSSRSEGLGISNAGDQRRCGERRPDAGDRIQPLAVTLDRCQVIIRRSNSRIWAFNARN